MTLVKENSESVLRRIELAAERSGRSPSEIELVAVTKTVDTKAIREAVGAGLRTFGESRVQEALDKVPEFTGMGIKWHMIGHLQKNKAKAAAGLFEVIHSVDSVELMAALDKYSANLGKVQKVLIQVKLVAEDVSKHGIEERGMETLIERSRGLKNIKVDGLMTIPPFYDDPERARPIYRRLKTLATMHGLKELSMGMTGDFEIAIEEGATMVRVGAAIFGSREKW